MSNTELKPLAYVTAIEEGRTIFLPRWALDCDGMVPLCSLTAAQEAIARLEAECQEQARLNGMGSEREARLMTERDTARAELAAMREPLSNEAAFAILQSPDLEGWIGWENGIPEWRDGQTVNLDGWFTDEQLRAILHFHPDRISASRGKESQ